jgi:hypothetical protein
MRDGSAPTRITTDHTTTWPTRHEIAEPTSPRAATSADTQRHGVRMYSGCLVTHAERVSALTVDMRPSAPGRCLEAPHNHESPAMCKLFPWIGIVYNVRQIVFGLVWFALAPIRRYQLTGRLQGCGVLQVNPSHPSIPAVQTSSKDHAALLSSRNTVCTEQTT